MRAKDRMKHDRTIRAAMKQMLLPEGVRTIDELGIVGCAIADVVTLGEEIHGYEIKAWNDTLKRLPDQIQMYDFAFDRCTLITTMRHEEKAMELLPEHWGMVVTLGNFKTDEVTSFVTVREALPNPNQAINYLLSMVWCDELKEHLKSIGAARGCRNGHQMRTRMMEIYEPTALKGFVIERFLSRQNWKVIT